jgi:hypothetical protein
MLHLCVLVRTCLAEQRTKIAALLASLLAAGDGACNATHPMRVSVDIVPTDANDTIAHTTHRLAVELARREQLLQPWFRVRAHSRPTEAERKSHWETMCPNKKLHWCGPPGATCGYLETDLLLQKLLARRAGPYPEEESAACSHIMVTNGDNLYSSALLHSTCPLMYTGLDLVSYFFSSHYDFTPDYVRAGRVERPGPHVLFKTRLGQPGWADLGAVIFRAAHLRDVAAKFTDCGRWREADGRLLHWLVHSRNASRRVLDRILFMHQ